MFAGQITDDVFQHWPVYVCRNFQSSLSDFCLKFSPKFIVLNLVALNDTSPSFCSYHFFSDFSVIAASLRI